MKPTLLFISLLCFLKMNSQQFAGIYTMGYWTTALVQKEMETDIAKGEKNGTIASSLKSQVGDTLIYMVNHKMDPFTAKYTFKLSGFDEPYCDFEEYNFKSAKGSQRHFQDLLKYYKFLQKSENVYVSKPKYKTEMLVKHNSDNDSCLILTFKHLSLQEGEYKLLYKDLKKKNAAKAKVK